MHNVIVDIEGRPGLVRDISTGAIVNTSRVDYDNYVANKAKSQALREKIKTQDQEIQQIKGDLNDIKQMLSQLLSVQGRQGS